MSDLAHRRYVVTGGTSGIGKEIAMALAARGARVVLVARDRERGEAACAAIRSRTGGAAELVVGDLGVLSEVSRAAGSIAGAGPVHGVINNAGVWRTELRVTTGGLEETFAVNVLGPFHFTRLLTPALARGARVVNLASYLYRRGRRLDFEALARGASFHPVKTYADSHLAIVWWTQLLSRELAARGVTANVVHPGTVRTNLASGARGIVGWLYRAGELLAAPASRGALAPVHVATAPELEGVTGAYFAKLRRRPITGLGTDLEAARDLWRGCEAHVGRMPR
jgi:retinol dehydrogenase-12